MNKNDKKVVNRMFLALFDDYKKKIEKVMREGASKNALLIEEINGLEYLMKCADLDRFMYLYEKENIRLLKDPYMAIYRENMRSHF